MDSNQFMVEFPQRIISLYFLSNATFLKAAELLNKMATLPLPSMSNVLCCRCV